VGYGTKLAERYDRAHGLQPGETIIVISNSGKNSSPLEVALYAKQKGLVVVGLTCVEMSKTAATVHPGGKSCTRRGLCARQRRRARRRDHPGGRGVMAGPTSTFNRRDTAQSPLARGHRLVKAGGHPLPILRSQTYPAPSNTTASSARSTKAGSVASWPDPFYTKNAKVAKCHHTQPLPLLLRDPRVTKWNFKIGVDGGGTKTECILVDLSGAIVARELAPGCNPSQVGPEQARAIVTIALTALCSKLPAGSVQSTLLCMRATASSGGKPRRR